MGNVPAAGAEGARRATGATAARAAAGATAARAATERPSPVSIRSLLAVHAGSFSPAQGATRSHTLAGVRRSRLPGRRRGSYDAKYRPSPRRLCRSLVVPRVGILVLHRSPQPFDPDGVECTAPPSRRIAIPASVSTSVTASDVHWAHGTGHLTPPAAKTGRECVKWFVGHWPLRPPRRTLTAGPGYLLCPDLRGHRAASPPNVEKPAVNTLLFFGYISG